MSAKNCGRKWTKSRELALSLCVHACVCICIHVCVCVFVYAGMFVYCLFYPVCFTQGGAILWNDIDEAVAYIKVDCLGLCDGCVFRSLGCCIVLPVKC